MNLTTYNFNGAPVRTVTLPNGEPGFVGKDVADRLGYEDPTTAIRSHCRGVQILHPIPDALGRMQPTRILTEPDVLRLIVSSTLPAAQEFERWVFEEVLPSIRKTGSYSARPAAQAAEVTALQLALTSAQMTADILRLEGSARLGMVRQAHELAGAAHLLPMLPAYAIDAPPDELTTRGSSRPTASMLTILQRACLGTACKKPTTKMVASVYGVLLAAGILEQRTRPSTSSVTGFTHFWSITEKGLRFGKNVTNEKNQREPAPHWYTDTAGELLDLAYTTARI